MTKSKTDSILENRIQILKKTKIFSESGDEILFEIADTLTETIAKKEKVILKKGDVGKAMYILVKGRVRVHDGNHVLSRLGEGSVFGEYSLIDEESRSATVTAEEDSVLLKLSQEDFYNLISKNQNILKGVLKVLIGRMRDMNSLEEKLAKSYIKIQTQKKEIEEQHLNILEQKELLEEQNYDLLSLNEEKNHFISVLVHGMKNPLTSCLCLADLLKTEINDPQHPHHEHAEIIHNSLERMNKMINEVLNVNKIESKTLHLQLETLEIGKIIKNVINHFKFPIEKKQLNIRLNLEKSVSKLNSVYTYQIIDNLLSNAIKFSSPHKNIDIKVTHKGERVLIQISDEGPGIPKEKFENLFNQYERQTDWKNENPTVGLGLAIVKKYVDAMGGKVWCESEEGKGSCFYVEFNRISCN